MIIYPQFLGVICYREKNNWQEIILDPSNRFCSNMITGDFTSNLLSKTLLKDRFLRFNE